VLFTVSKLALSLLCLVFLVVPREADAYLDPATGSAIIQMVVASVMGALFVVRVYWRRIRAFFGGPVVREEKQESAPGGEAARR
jgi:O-antigen/teichoic acid export membrane protein